MATCQGCKKQISSDEVSHVARPLYQSAAVVLCDPCLVEVDRVKAFIAERPSTKV